MDIRGKPTEELERTTKKLKISNTFKINLFETYILLKDIKKKPTSKGKIGLFLSYFQFFKFPLYYILLYFTLLNFISFHYNSFMKR